MTDVGQRAAEDVKEGAWMGTKKTRHRGNKHSEWTGCWGWVERNRDSAKVRTRLATVQSGLREGERDSRLLSCHFFVIGRSCFSVQNNSGVVSIAWYNGLLRGWLGQRGQELVEEGRC